MTLRKLFSLAIVLAAISGPLHAIDKVNPPENIEPWRQLTAKLTEHALLEWKFLLFPEGIRVRTGEYKIQQEVNIDGKKYALLPASRHITGKGWAEQNTSEHIFANCYITDTYFLLIEIESGKPLNRAFFKSTKGNSICPENSFYPYYLDKPGKFKKEPSISLTRQFQSENEYHAYVKNIESMNANAKQDQYNLRAINNSSKQKIGARVCKTQGSTVLIGYTEKVSPDNGKIQVRISDSRYGGPNGSSVSGFKETIIWEDPTLWDICE